MSAIIRSRVTQYRLIIEDEVQAGRQALTYALNSRPRQPGWLSYFRLFFSFVPTGSPSLTYGQERLSRTLIIATLMRLCYFSPYPWQLDPVETWPTFSIRVNRSRASQARGMPPRQCSCILRGGVVFEKGINFSIQELGLRDNLDWIYLHRSGLEFRIDEVSKRTGLIVNWLRLVPNDWKEINNFLILTNYFYLSFITFNTACESCTSTRSKRCCGERKGSSYFNLVCNSQMQLINGRSKKFIRNW